MINTCVLLAYQKSGTQDPERTQDPRRIQNPMRTQDPMRTQNPMRTQDPRVPKRTQSSRKTHQTLLNSNFTSYIRILLLSVLIFTQL